jgi:hypothetical protein
MRTARKEFGPMQRGRMPGGVSSPSFWIPPGNGADFLLKPGGRLASGRSGIQRAKAIEAAGV